MQGLKLPLELYKTSVRLVENGHQILLAVQISLPPPFVRSPTKNLCKEQSFHAMNTMSKWLKTQSEYFCLEEINKFAFYGKIYFKKWTLYFKKEGKVFILDKMIFIL